jgi:hypothetical protein
MRSAYVDPVAWFTGLLALRFSKATYEQSCTVSMRTCSNTARHGLAGHSWRKQCQRLLGLATWRVSDGINGVKWKQYRLFVVRCGVGCAYDVVVSLSRVSAKSSVSDLAAVVCILIVLCFSFELHSLVTVRL